MKIITNNPKVKAYFSDREVIWIEGSYGDVLKQTRDCIHQNHELLTHPLSGSIKPNETPYKSIAVKDGSKMDFDQLNLIEKAIETYVKLQKDVKTPNWSESIREDFMVIDLDLIKNAIK